MKVVLYWSQLSMSLGKLLRVHFIRHQNQGGPVGRMLDRVIDLHNAGKHDSRDYTLTQLALLKCDLETIRDYDSSLLRRFQEVYRHIRLNEYFGFRMEVATAAVLIRKQIPFEKTESPDFVAHLTEGDVFIECTSTHLRETRNKPIGYKIQSAIRRKVDLPFANPDTVLFVDITNILGNTLITGHYLWPADLDVLVHEVLLGGSLGSVCLLFYLLMKESDYYALTFHRVDNGCISDRLYAFLNAEFLPSGDGSISDYAIPLVG